MDVILATVIPAAGLSELWQTILQGWVGPIFLAAIAVFAIVFLKDRAWMKLISFVGIAAVVAVLIYAGPALFGQGGTFQSVAQNAATKVN